jgi:hypothetical protein
MINETLFHAEEGTFRAITGSTYNIPNAYGEIMRGSSFPTKGTIPDAVTREGTFKSTGKAVRGTGTQFTKLLQGSYLYNGDVIRQIDHVVSDDLLFLKQAFPSDVSVATTVKVCERQFFKRIYAKNTHESASVTIQEASLRPGDPVLNGGAPLSYDAGSGEITFTVHQ